MIEKLVDEKILLQGVTHLDSSSPSHQPRRKERLSSWSIEEHGRFLVGLETYGWEEWPKISKYAVFTKTPAQVMFHAKKLLDHQRQREEEERIEKERKRNCFEEVNQREEEERIEKEIKWNFVKEAKRKYDAVDAKSEGNECVEDTKKCNNLANNREGNMKIPLAQTFSSKNPMTGETKESLKHSKAVNVCGTKEEVTANLTKGFENDNLIAQNMIEVQSYDISPYRNSDYEEDSDGSKDKKFVPPWASKQSLYEAVCSQKLVNPETIFPQRSFGNASKVLPRNFRKRWRKK